MAIVYCNAAVDLNRLNLNELQGGTIGFLDNVNFTSHLGNVYQDVWRSVSDDAEPERTSLMGSGITVGAGLAITGGTVRGLQWDAWNGSSWSTLSGMEGIAISAVAVYNAILTPDRGDDLAVFATALAGADSLRLSEGDDDMRGFAGNDTLRGLGGNDMLFGDEGNDSIEGGTGNDLLFGNAGTDTLVGGAGSDTYYVDGADLVVETSTLAGETDIVRSTGSRTLGANLEVLVLDGAEPIDGTGNSLANQILGNSAANQLDGQAGNDTLRAASGNDTLLGGTGNDTLDGGTGGDRMIGGTGNDSYLVDSTADTTLETSTLASELDSVTTTISHTLAANIEKLFLGGSAAIAGTGNTRPNVIVGNAAANRISGLAGDDSLLGQGGNDSIEGGTGNDTVDGGIGNDTLVGGSGNDVFVVNNAYDRVVETGTTTTEIDTVLSSVAYTLGANLERLGLIGGGSISGTGNARANLINGGAGSNLLSGLAGIDSLNGGDGNDTLDGGTGADSMTGGPGDDRYLVDHAADVVLEGAGGGTDTVVAGVSHTLAANVERLTLTGTSAIDGSGNALANLITGNAAANTLVGEAGDDTLNGGAGNDRLDGGLGRDSLAGGDGSDVYVVDNLSDVVSETGTAASAADMVQSAVTWSLDKTGNTTVERLTLVGTEAVDGTGNALANLITGNGAANRLDGGAGNDTLVGGAGHDTLTGGSGNDTYRVADAGDRIDESSTIETEIDQVFASVDWTLGANLENLTLEGSAAIDGFGNTLSNILTGNAAANTLDGKEGFDLLLGQGGADSLAGGLGNDELRGDAGNDTLDGGPGIDTLAGGAGADEFRFAWPLDALHNVDLVTDFVAVDDRLWLDDAVFDVLAPGALPAGQFRIGTVAQDADDHLLFDTTTGRLLYDADGSGSLFEPVHFANLGSATAVSAADFWIG